ncbi:hypothetical protein [uncultured Mailhella sp.]|uniref:hypothetical protein n=1 Tax=uncultured Mailhella sp. TaxID=1981031 RepID=UPI002612D109|nr:hypothetical protein [uncultured Mailhella sp.]
MGGRKKSSDVCLPLMLQHMGAAFAALKGTARKNASLKKEAAGKPQPLRFNAEKGYFTV